MVKPKYVRVWGWQCSYCGRFFHRFGSVYPGVAKVEADHCCERYASEVDE